MACVFYPCSLCNPRGLVGFHMGLDSKQDYYEDCPAAIAVKDARGSL